MLVRELVPVTFCWTQFRMVSCLIVHQHGIFITIGWKTWVIFNSWMNNWRVKGLSNRYNTSQRVCQNYRAYQGKKHRLGFVIDCDRPIEMNSWWHQSFHKKVLGPLVNWLKQITNAMVNLKDGFYHLGVNIDSQTY